MRRRGRVVLIAIAAAAAAAAAIGAGGPTAAARHTARPTAAARHTARPRARAAGAPVDATFTVGPGTYGQIPAAFLGLSIEWWGLESYAGRDPRALDPVLVKLIRNLTQGHSTVLRIGGVTTDQTWWPVQRVPRPPGAFYTLNRRRLKVAKALARATRAKLILGVQFEADSTTEAAAEARAMLKYVGRRTLEGLELGNEPELFPHAAFYTRHGAPVYGRPPGYTFQSFVRDYAHIAAAMGRVPLAGPATGDPAWMAGLGQLLAAEPGIRVVTLHRYPLQGCSVPSSAPNYPTIPNLLSDPTATGAADRFAAFVGTAHARGVRVRDAEMNTVACGNGRGVANTFASALWVVAELFESVSIGFDGVNIHTYPGSADQLFAIERRSGRWRASVAPEYYGVLLFSQAAPPGAHLLDVYEAGNGAQLRVWATRSASGRTRVVLINDNLASAKTVAVSVPGARTAATLELLHAPGAAATRGVTIGGRSYRSPTTTVTLHGRARIDRLTAVDGQYTVTLPPASAALLTIR